jgi:hypothetical protein
MEWVIVLLVVVVVLVVGALAIERRRSAALRSRFGPEYERLVEESHGDRRGVEAALRERLKQRDEVDLRAMSPAATERYVAQWQAVQAGFVDEPRQSVAAAEVLIDQVLTERGYPADAGEGDGSDETDRLELVAVDHAPLVADYRQAQSVVHRDGDASAEVSLDELRFVFIRYRALFDALVDRGAERRPAVGFASPEASS